MFNGKILRELIANAGLTNKQFQQQMFGSKSTDLYHLENSKNLRSDTLERLRDVLKCSMDEFFTTPEWAEDGTLGKAGSSKALPGAVSGSSYSEVQYLKELLLEKTKRIEVLENYVKLLEQQTSRT